MKDAPPAQPRSPDIERHHIDWSRPALDGAAELLIESGRRRTTGAADLSDVVVVLPGARAGRRLQELLLERSEANGAPLRPPRLVTTGALPELLVPLPGAPAPDLLVHRLWAEALRSLPAGGRETLLTQPPAHDDLAGWMKLGRTVQQLQATVAAGGHSFAGVARVCAEGFLFNDEERWRVLASARARMLTDLEGMGLTDRHEHRRLSAGEGLPDQAPFPDELWLVGVVELPGVTRTLLERAVEAGLPLRVVVHAPSGLSGDFDELGCVVPGAWADRPLELPDASIRPASDPRQQADRVVEALRSAPSGLTSEEVTIGVPDPEVIPFLRDRLAEEGILARTASGTPIEQSGPFRLLSAVADFISDRSWEAFAALIRHPDLASSPAGSALSDLDRYHSIHLPRRLAPGASLPVGGEPTQGAPGPAVQAILALLDDELLAGFQGFRPMSEWGEPVTAFVLRVYGEGELDPNRPGDRALIAVAEGLSGVIEGLRSLSYEVDTRVEAGMALRILLDELRGGAVPEAGEEEAVELLGWLELHLDDAPFLAVTGMNEPHVPASITGDPFLPHTLRSRLGLLDNEGRRARDLYQLSAIMASRPGTVLIPGRRTQAGDPLRPSRLLLAERGEHLARRVSFFTEGDPTEGAGDGRPAAEAPADGDLPALPGDPFSLPPEPELRAEVLEERLSVTSFRTLLADPYLFALERILGLGAVDDQALELDPGGFGTLLHRVLERFSAGLAEAGPEARSDPRRLRERLDAQLDREAAHRFGEPVRPAVRLQVEQMRARLHAFADWEAGWAAEGWETRAIEARPASREGVTFEVDGRGIQLVGRIDRIDHHPASGRWILFDYKTSASPKTPDETHRRRQGRGRDAPKVWVDLQLPLYRHLVRGVRAPTDDGSPLIPLGDLDRVEAGYILLPPALDRTGAALSDWTRAELLEADERAREAVRRYRENRFVWDPDASTIRPDSPLAALTGKGAWRDLEPGDEEADDV
jgi:ATP-dependent helicase/nuclease subunit B